MIINKSTGQYFEFQLEGESEVYRIPTPLHLPVRFLFKLNEPTLPNQIDILREYMGDRVDNLSVMDISNIFAAWAASSPEVTLGES